MEVQVAGPAANTDASLSSVRAAAGTAPDGLRASADPRASAGISGRPPSVAPAWPAPRIPPSNTGSAAHIDGKAKTRPHSEGTDGRTGPRNGSEPAGLDFFSAPCDPGLRWWVLFRTGSPTRARSANSGPSVYPGYYRLPLYAPARGDIKKPPAIPRAGSDRAAAVWEGCYQTVLQPRHLQGRLLHRWFVLCSINRKRGESLPRLPTLVGIYIVDSVAKWC
jgi:hypothetical protein